MKRSKSRLRDSNQTKLPLLLSAYPFRLRAGDVFLSEGQFCRVIRVTECAAVLLVNQPARKFKTRFDRPVHFQQPPKYVRISPNAEPEILNRKTK